MANTISVQILGEASKLKSELNKANGYLGGFSKTAGKIGTVLKGVFAAAVIGKGIQAVKDFASESISAASDLQQSTGAVKAVFGKQAAGIKKVASGAAESFGLSKNAYQELASVLGAGLKNQGIKDFAGQTQKVIGLGADLASQFGGSTKDAVEAIGSLMRGEADPIERYGVGIKQSAVSAYLAARGQSKLTGAAKTQAEAQARLALLFEQTTSAQGNFGRESDTLAHKQQVNAAKWTDIKAKFGTILLPVMTKLADVIGKTVLPAVERFVGFMEKNLPGAIEKVKGFLAGLKGDGTLASYFQTAQGVLGTVFQILKDIAAAIIANWPQIKEAIVTALSAIQTGSAALKAFWDEWGPTISKVIGNAFTTVVTIISGALQIISGTIKFWTSLFTGDFKGAADSIKLIWSGAWTIIKGIFVGVLEQIHAVVRKFVPQMPATFREGFEQVRAAVATKIEAARAAVANALALIKSKVSSTLSAIKSTWSSAWDGLKSKLSSAWSAIVSTVSTKVNEVKQKISDLKSKITDVFSNAGSWLADAGRRIISGLLSGINERIGQVRAKLRELTNLIPSWKGPRDRDSKLLTEAGQLIMESLVKGFEKGESGVKAQLQSVTRYIGGALDDVMSPTLRPSLSLAATNASLKGLRGPGQAQGGDTYQITVQVAPTANQAEIGREIVGAIDAYKKLGGRRPAS